MNNKKIKNINRSEVKSEKDYQDPEIFEISANQINKATSCACSAEDDNPY